MPPVVTGELEAFEVGFWLFAELLDLKENVRPGKDGKEGFTKYTVVVRTDDGTYFVDYRSEQAARQAIGAAAIGQEIWQQVRLNSQARIYLDGANSAAGSPGGGKSIL
jgi:hypothetical protein